MKFCLIISVLLVFSHVSYSQKFEIENKFHIKQDEKSITFRVLDADDSQLKKYCPTKNYYWFKSQRILITQGGSSGSLLNGDYESFYKNNQLAEKGFFKKGLKNGIWMFWNQNGVLVQQENWSKGIQIGKQIYYNQKGLIQKTVIYKSDQTQIISRDTTILKTKKTVLTTISDSTGKLIAQSRYSNYKLDGAQIARDQNDSLIKTVYKKGILIPEKSKAEKLSFKQKMSNFWEKLKFWEKFKKKGQREKEAKSVEKPKKTAEKEKKKRTE